ncbi:hypothetical protein A7982_13065 [Minicystis rosea]|nr:hypothetical protein A7982_13065 [Minicystis rosea]
MEWPGGEARRGLVLGAALALCVSCNRGGTSATVVADAGAPAAPAGRAVPATGRVEREGIAIAFELRPVNGPVGAHADAAAVFTITDAKTGAPVRGLRPMAWMSRRGSEAAPDDAACKAKVKSYLAGLISAKADVEMNAYHLWVLGGDGTISIVDPTVAFSRTKLQGVIELDARAADWTMSADRSSLFVSLPEKQSLAIVDVPKRAVAARVSVGAGAARVAVAPDGRRVWVGNDGGASVSVVDAQTHAVEATLRAGAGHHEIAFADHGQTAWITSRGGDDVVVVDARSLAVIGTVPVGRGAVAMAASEAAQAVYVANAETGEVVVIDAARRTVVSRIAQKRGLAALRFDPSGRFAFAANRVEGELAIIDATSARVTRTLTGLGAPDEIAFTGSFAYVRQPSVAKMSVIELNTIDRQGSLAAIDVPVGQAAATEPRGALASLIAPTPEGNSVMVASPADKNLHYFVEGMMAPVGSHRTYGRAPEGLLIVDRTLTESAPGVYAATVQLGKAGAYDVSILLDRPRFAACLEEMVPVGAGRAAEADTPRLTIAPLFDPKLQLRPGVPVTLRFRLHEGTERAAVTAADIDLLIIRFPGGHRFRGRPQDEGDGVYSVTYTPPTPGEYRVLAAVASRGLPFGKIPHLTLGVERDAPRDERRGTP